MMILYAIFSLFGFLIAVLAVAGLGLGLFFLFGSVGLDGLFAVGTPHGELTCWHCGETTRAGVKHCTHCGGELQ